MDVSDLKVFEAVARLGSMNRAALELNTVQSNVTAKIRNLELELGVQLFQRQARGVQLTPAGRRLLPFSPKLSKLLSDARTAALDDGSPNGALEIGTLETTAALRLPTVLANFARTYPSVTEDIAAIEAVRCVAGDDVAIMVDYNQALTVVEAFDRGRNLDRLSVYWLEEPIGHDDYESSAALARELRVPVQIGENFNGPAAMMHALECRACDLVMPDVARMGGVTGWMQAAGIAGAKGLEMSSHLMPEISAHLLSATPTAHWLEYVDWADAILESPLRISDGRVDVGTSAGSGVVWDEAKLKRLNSL